MSILAALLPNQDRLYRLHAAIRGRHQIAPCEDWGALRLICETQPVIMAVFDLYAGNDPSFEPVRQIRRLFPRLITVAYVGASIERARDLFDAGRAGIDGLIIADRDDSPQRLAAILEQAEARSVASQLRGTLADYHPLVRDAVLLVVTRAHERLTPEVLARTLSMGRRSLTKRLTDAGFPPPQRLITWGRLIVAAQLLEDTHRSADAVSLALDFPSGSAFRNTCQRYLQATPSQMRERGGSSFVIRRLLGDTDSHTIGQTA